MVLMNCCRISEFHTRRTPYQSIDLLEHWITHCEDQRLLIYKKTLLRTFYHRTSIDKSAGSLFTCLIISHTVFITSVLNFIRVMMLQTISLTLRYSKQILIFVSSGRPNGQTAVKHHKPVHVCCGPTLWDRKYSVAISISIGESPYLYGVYSYRIIVRTANVNMLLVSWLIDWFPFLSNLLCQTNA